MVGAREKWHLGGSDGFLEWKVVGQDDLQTVSHNSHPFRLRLGFMLSTTKEEVIVSLKMHFTDMARKWTGTAAFNSFDFLI